MTLHIYDCNHCGASFVTPELYKRHIRDKHHVGMKLFAEQDLSQLSEAELVEGMQILLNQLAENMKRAVVSP